MSITQTTMTSTDETQRASDSPLTEALVFPHRPGSDVLIEASACREIEKRLRGEMARLREENEILARQRDAWAGKCAKSHVEIIAAENARLREENRVLKSGITQGAGSDIPVADVRGIFSNASDEGSSPTVCRNPKG